MPGPASSSSSSTAPPDARRQRRRQLRPPSSSAATPTSTSSGSSSSSSASSGALSFFSPAPSPFHHHRFLSPLRSSAVPFSWEHRPGIPKTPARQKSAGSSGSKPAAKTLPLPPFLLSRKVGAAAAAADPFAYPDAAGGYFLVPGDAKTPRWRRRRRQHRPRRPPALAATLTDWLAVLSLYRSCARSRDCLAVTPPRPRSPTKASAA